MFLFSRIDVGAQPNLSPPVVLPGDTELFSAAGKQEKPQIAKGSESFLAVWTDTRSALAPNGTMGVGGGGPYFGPGLGTMNDIYAARLDQNGNVIDQYPILVSQAPYNQSYPQAAWNGQNWLVVWYQEQENNYYSYEMRGVRISPDGAVLDKTPITIGTAGNYLGGFPVNLLFDGINWVVIWEGFNAAQTARTIFAARIAPDAAVLDPQGFAVYNHSSQFLSDPDIAFNGSGFLLVFLDMIEDKVYGLRLSPALEPVGNTFTINNFTPSKPANLQVASNGDGYFVVWDEHPFSGNIGEVKGSRVSAAGTVLDPNGIEIDSNNGVTESSPNVVWNGSKWFVVYDSGFNSTTDNYDDQDIYVKRISPAGAILDANPIHVSNALSHQIFPSITVGFDNSVQIVWHDLRMEEDIFTTRVSDQGSAGTEKNLSLGAPRQSKPRTAFGGNVFFNVFQRETAGNSQIYGQRLDSRGNPLDAQPFLISNPAIRTNGSPAAAFNGEVFLVVWDAAENDQFGNIIRKIYGRRFSPGGAPVDVSPFFIMNGETPDTAALDGTFLNVAIRPIGRQIRNVEAVRVSGAGTVLGSPALVLSNFNYAPRVAAFGNRWLTVWEYHSGHDNPRSWIRASYIDTGGLVSESFQIAGGEDSNPNLNYDDTPHLAVSGNEALIVWQDNDTNQNNIKGRRIQMNGTLLGGDSGFLISDAPGSQFLPAVTWNGNHYMATWVDQRRDQFPAQPRGDIFAARISQDGIVLDPAGFPVADSALPEDTPFVFSGNGVSVFSYSAFYDRFPFSAMRVTIRTSGSPSSAAKPFDFDGDGRTDVSVFRPSVGEWWLLYSNNSGHLGIQFGSNSDLIAPADFTGDGRTDIAFFRPSEGFWYVLRSEDNTFYAFPFGISTDIPAPGDFDGDGRADPAVFRPSEGMWFILRSSDGGVTFSQFGLQGDVPVAADYDGDGKSDIAVYRPSNGQWWLNRSADGIIGVTFGISTDKPVPGDYTGDGKADIAFYRPAEGFWYILRSEDSSFYAFPFGISTDTPAPGDYDGDGRMDAAVYRQGTWYLLQSTAGFAAVQFGIAGDRPIPSAFVP